MMSTRWTPDEDDALRKLAKAGRTVYDIQKVLKIRTVNGIEARARVIGVKVGRGPRPEIDMELLNAMLKEKII